MNRKIYCVLSTFLIAFTLISRVSAAYLGYNVVDKHIVMSLNNQLVQGNTHCGMVAFMEDIRFDNQFFR
ncbi:MAG: hypothetical protein WCF28_05760 [Methanobacterium sp.]|uniref:hypothetical protein n=1 Tax=Methanobacterium sp. TaxID=2164 RepID=UPI003C7591A3